LSISSRARWQSKKAASIQKQSRREYFPAAFFEKWKID